MTERSRTAVVALFAATLAATCPAEGPVVARGAQWGVATAQPIATDAAADVFRRGGNAVDAAVCAALTLGVVDNHNSGLGGGCLILVRSPGGEFIAIDGRETAPAGASRDMFRRDGVVDPELSRVGPLAVGTPGALAAYAKLLGRCGTLPLAELLEPGRVAAAEGFPIDSNYASRLAAEAPLLRRDPGARARLLTAGGAPHAEGATLRQPDLAGTYAAIASGGPDWFYRGPLADRVGRWMERHGGALRASDFATYEAVEREPIVTTYRGHSVIGFPPPSSGGVHVAQTLGMLERFDLKSAFAEDPGLAAHLVAEALKLAFADRAHWLGDPGFAETPRGLIGAEYLAEQSGGIDPTAATVVGAHGTPPAWRQDLFGRHTTHVAAADAEGWWVGITATVNTGFGAKVIVPGTGVVLNNQMDDFAIAPGTPNSFGLVGGENNSVAPGKRPLSNMSPTIVLGPDGEPLLTVGAAGGPRIISQVALALVRVIDGGESLEAAIAAPRWHHQWRPDELLVEESLPPGVVDALRRRGHEVRVSSTLGVSQGVARGRDGRLLAVRDPRVPGAAAAE